MQGPIQGTTHRIAAMHFRNDVMNGFWNHDPVVNEDSPNHQDSFLDLHLASHFAAEGAAPCLDIPRCQRGGKCALQSSCRGGYHVVDRRRSRFFDRCRVKTVMSGDCAVDPKEHRGRFRRKLGQPNGALSAVDLAFINICRLWHRLSFHVPRRRSRYSHARGASIQWPRKPLKMSSICRESASPGWL
jgi:hypothetical protein